MRLASINPATEEVIGVVEADSRDSITEKVQVARRAQKEWGRLRLRERAELVSAAGEKLDDPLEMYNSDIFTVAANLAGLPAISIPCPHSEGELPGSFQILAPAGEDWKLLRFAAMVERMVG